jgi:thymidine kinase
MEVSDSIREIKSMCPCGKKATMNARYKNGKIIYSGNQIDIGGDDKYQSLCYDCWKKGRLYK